MKKIKILTQPQTKKVAEGVFNFSDGNSVFDLGQMPDSIPEKKGATTLLLVAFF